MAKNGKPLRFAALIRVSTEKQEQQGESLRTQASIIEDSVKIHGGKVVKKYAGQEHATAGWERQQLDQLLADAAKKPCPFDAVIVASESRWSRHNETSKAALRILKNNDIRFFVGRIEYPLRDPKAKFWLGISAEIDELKASMQNQDSILNRIARAKRGIPTCGKLPFGRTFDKKTEKWGIVPEKKAMMEDVAKRYLAGESMPDLADEYGVNATNLHKTLMHRCGVDWEQKFHCDEPEIDETILTTIPRLLPEKIIKACRAQADANRTYRRKKVDAYFKNKYLLSGFIFCDHCGYALGGEMNHGKIRNYRHAPKRGRVISCPCEKKTLVNSDKIEARVIERLFETFGNPTAVQRAIADAIPNQEKVAELRAQQKRLTEALAKTKDSQKRLLQKEVEGDYDEDAIKELKTKYSKQKSTQEEKLQKINDQLEHLPSGDLVVTQEMMERIQQTLFPATVYERQRKMPQLVPNKNGRLSAKLWAKTGAFDDDIARMTWDDKRSLVEAVFGGRTLEGKRAGVYIRWRTGENGKPVWRYTIHGILLSPNDFIETNGVIGAALR